MWGWDFVKRYLLPGMVFQSIVIGGGYGTGRELVEFFLRYGPMGGLLAMFGINTVIWSCVCAVSFEFARVRRVYDYRSFFQQLLGRGWVGYEICFLLLMLLVLAVTAAATGSIFLETFGLPYYAGVLTMMASVGFLVLKGSATIEKFFSFWSAALYLTYIVFCVWCFSRFGGAILAGLASGEARPGWAIGGAQYAAYNIGIVPAVLFSVRHATRRKEAVTAGLLAGLIGILPAFMFFLAMVGEYPAILTKTVPSNHLLQILGSKAFQYTFQIILVGTLIQTGAGLVHAFNERLAVVFLEKKTAMPASLRLAIGVTLLVLATVTARFGLVDLIAKGYGTITWGFWLAYVIPVLTLGLWKLVKAPRVEGASATETAV